MDSSSAIARLVSGLMLIGTVGAAVLATGLDALTIVFWRSAIGAAFMLVWCLTTGLLPDRSLSLRNLAVGLVAGTSLVLSWAAFFAGIMLTSISTATILFHIQPFLIVVIGAILWRERITQNQLIWLGLAFMGVVLASGLTLPQGQANRDWALGIAITLGGAFLYAITAIAGKGLAGQRGEITTLIQTIAGTLIFLPFVDFGQPIAIQSWGWLAVIGVVQTGIAWVLVYSAYPRLSTPMLAVLSFINPVTAIMSDWLFFGHLIGPVQALGLVLIIASTLGVKLGWAPWRRRQAA